MTAETSKDLSAACLERWDLDCGVWDDPACAMRVDPDGEFVEFEAAKRVIDALRDAIEALTARATAAEAALAVVMAGAVRVKPLEWVARYAKYDGGREHFGTGVFGHWYGVKREKNGSWLVSHHIGATRVEVGFFPTLDAAKAAAQADYERRILAALEPNPAAQDRDALIADGHGVYLTHDALAAVRREARAELGPIGDLLSEAIVAAEKAMIKFPQPNYVISKWAEETGEVTKAAIHMAEGRESPIALKGEIVQSLAMLHRLMIEGDEVHGLPPVADAILAAAQKEADRAPTVQQEATQLSWPAATADNTTLPAIDETTGALIRKEGEA